MIIQNLMQLFEKKNMSTNICFLPILKTCDTTYLDKLRSLKFCNCAQVNALENERALSNIVFDF